MIVCTLVWTEPQEGSHTIFFADDCLTDLFEVAKFVKDKMGDEVGETIASMKIQQKKEGTHGRAFLQENTVRLDPWDDLALNIRYSSGEELYDEDCPAFTKHGQERC
jgi:hypothetical protein